MAPDPLFDGAWAKWAQGVKHTHALEDDIDAFSVKRNREPVLRARTDYDAKRHGFVVRVEAIEPIPVEWSLILGDAANNFRAALDHLAWALVSRGRTPPGSGKLTKGQERAVYFPICEHRSEFNAEIRLPSAKSRPKLPGIRRADGAQIRRFQPYHQGPSVRALHGLMRLAAINSADKHRTLQPFWIEPSVTRIKITKSRDCVVREIPMGRWLKQPLEVNAELAYIAARKTGPDPKLGMKIQVEVEPSVGGKLTFKEWGTRTAALLSLILIAFSEPSEGLLESLVDLPRFMVSAKAMEV